MAKKESHFRLYSTSPYTICESFPLFSQFDDLRSWSHLYNQLTMLNVTVNICNNLDQFVFLKVSHLLLSHILLSHLLFSHLILSHLLLSHLLLSHLLLSHFLLSHLLLSHLLLSHLLLSLLLLSHLLLSLT